MPRFRPMQGTCHGACRPSGHHGRRRSGHTTGGNFITVSRQCRAVTSLSPGSDITCDISSYVYGQASTPDFSRSQLHRFSNVLSLTLSETVQRYGGPLLASDHAERTRESKDTLSVRSSGGSCEGMAYPVETIPSPSGVASTTTP